MASAAPTHPAGSSVQAPPAASGLQLRDIFRTVQKRRWLVLIVLALVTLAGGLIGILAPRQYGATALVLVHTTPSGYLWLGEQKASEPAAQVSVETQARLVATLENAQKTAEQLAVGPGGGVHVTPTQIVNATTVEVIQPDILRVTVAMTNRDAVVPVVNTLAETYVETARERGRGTFTEAADVLTTQIENVQDKIDNLNKQKLRLLERGRTPDVTLEIQNVGEMARQLRIDRDTAAQQLAGVRNSLPALSAAVAREQPFENVPTVEANPQYDSLQAALDAKEDSLAALRARYTDEHPLVQNAQDEVASLRHRLAAVPRQTSRVTSQANKRYDEALSAFNGAQAQADALQASVASLDRALAQLSRRSAPLPRAQVEADQLASEIAIAQDTYKQLMTTLQEHQLRQASQTGIAEVADEASQAKAVTAPLFLTLVFSILLGLICGIVLALVLEALDTTIRSPDEVSRQTGLPLLGAIPLLEDSSPQVITLSAPQSPTSEAYRTLRSNIAFALTDLPARSFLVAATLGGEGKSSVAANLAVVTAHAGQMVILADTDLRKPVLADLFGLNPGIGLTNVLVGDATVEEVLQETGVPGLMLLASGPLPPNPAELLDSARMTEVITELHKRADVVIFDSPPALLLSDGVILSSKVDRVLLAAESGRVTVDAFREVLRLMVHARASVLGVVLNKYRVPTAGYYDHYFTEPAHRPGVREAPGETGGTSGA